MLGAPAPVLVEARLRVKYVPTSAGSSTKTYPLTPLTAPPDAFHSRRATPPPVDGSRMVALIVRPAARAGLSSATLDARTSASMARTLDQRRIETLPAISRMTEPPGMR